MASLMCHIARERRKHQYFLTNVYELLELSPRWQVPWGISLTNTLQPIIPLKIGYGCGQTYRLNVFLKWGIRIVSPRIFGSSAENFATTSVSRVFGTVEIFLLFSVRLPNELAAQELTAFAGGRGCMNSFLLPADRSTDISASVRLQKWTVVGPAYRKPAALWARMATTSK
jgi:hypothetical protein